MTEQQKKIAAGAGFGIVAVLILFFELHDSSGPSSPPPPPVIATAAATGATAARRVGTTASDLDPALHFGSMHETESLAYSGTGRNIFSATAPIPVSVPRPVAPARTVAIAPVEQGPQGPPLPPPIDLKFFGTASSAKKGRQAFLLRGDDVYLASAGDVVQRRYKVVSIAANSVLVEDLADNHQQSLPLLTNP